MPQRSIAECNAALDARNALLNDGTVEIRTGAPSDIDAAVTGTVRATLVLPSVVFGAAANRVATANTIAAVQATAANAGGQLHYVARNSSGAVMRNGTAGLAGSGAGMILTATTFNVGDDIEITSWTNSETKGAN